MPAAPPLRPASASSIGDEMTWLARLRTELEKGLAEYESARGRWEASIKAAEVGATERRKVGASEGRRWDELVVASEAGAMEMFTRPRAEMPAGNGEAAVALFAAEPVAAVAEPVVPAVPAMPAVPAAPVGQVGQVGPEDAAPAADWYFAEAGQTLGPYGTEELRARLRDGRLKGQTPVWNAQQAEWLPAEKSVLGEPAAPAAPAPPAVPTRRFCHSCGTPVNAGDRFCSNCGAALRAT